MSDLFVTRYIDRLKGGLAIPILVQANDKNKYVVKLLNNRVSHKVLINDFICSKLGHIMELPIPNVEKIFIPQQLIDVDSYMGQVGVQEGFHFASLYYDSINFIGSNSLELVRNKNDLANIMAFDLWVGNDDRCDNSGNLIIDTINEKVWAIDFGNGLNGPDWIKDDLECYDIYIPDLDGCVYGCIKNLIIGENPFGDICNRIESITYNEIKEIVDDVPDEWKINVEERKLICDFLDDRKQRVRECLHNLKRDFIYWR